MSVTALHTELEPADLSPRRARALVREALADTSVEHLLDDALLLVSELVTNAVVHAGTEIALRAAIGDGGMTVEVTDRGTGRLAPGQAAETAGSGRGLMLVDMLATEWGTRYGRATKTVWFRLGEVAPDSPPPAVLAVERGSRAAARASAQASAQYVGPRRDIAFLLGPADLEQRWSPQLVVEELLRRTVEGLERRSGWVLAGDVTDGFGGVGWTIRAAYDGGHPVPDAEAVRRGAVPADIGVCEPFLGADGEPAGALLLTGGPAGFDDSSLARLAAQRIGAVLRDDRARSAAERSRGSLALLVEAAELLAGVLDVRLAATLAARLATPRLARWSAVWTVFGSAPELQAVAHCDEDAVSGLRDLLEAEPVAAAIGEAAQRSGRHRYAEISGGGVVPFGDAGLAELGHGWLVELRSRGRVIGLVAVGDLLPYPPPDAALLSNLARIVALAVDNAQLYNERAEIASTLQAALLPQELPVAAAVQFGARFAAGGQGLEVGGDFYDVFEVGDGAWGVAVGDVCGKGAGPASITGVAREVLRIMLHDGICPAGAVTRLHRALLGMGERRKVCTVALGLVSRDAGGLNVRLCLAGHPPPLILRADGSTTMLGYGGTVLGATSWVAPPEEEVHLDPGDALVLYTDGVTERLGPSGQFGEAGLAAALSAAGGGSADELAEAVHSATRSHGTGWGADDSAVLVVRAAPRAAIGALDA
jgi:anti-sigma regulatory factor (Ser/Thr protein kinase)